MRIKVMAMVILLTFGGLAQAGDTTQYRVESVSEYELEVIHKRLIKEGKTGLTPIKGTFKWSMDDKAPIYYTVVCAKANGGMVRVEIKITKYPIEETTIKVLK